jgi:oligopeptide transport system substrate-binding protein
MTDNVPANALAMLRKEHPDEIVISPYLATAYYAFNLKGKPFAGNPKLRRALAMAIDRKRIVDSLALGQVPAYGFVPPNVWNYALQHWDWDSLSDEDRVAEARRLYREAGYSGDTPLNLRLLFNSNPVIKQTAIMIAAMWKEALGVHTDLAEEEFRVYLQSRHETTSWEIVREAWNADYNDATSFLNVLRKSAPNNDSGYVNTSFDELLDQAANTANAEIRRGLLQTAERIMLNDYPIVPLYYYVSKRLVKRYVLGVKPNPLDRVESKDLRLLPH